MADKNVEGAQPSRKQSEQSAPNRRRSSACSSSPGSQTACSRAKSRTATPSGSSTTAPEASAGRRKAKPRLRLSANGAARRTRRRISLVRLLPDPIARRLVVADPEVPASARRRRERPVDGADAVRASGAQRVAPDELRVMAALLAGSAGVRRVVVVLHLAGPGGDHVRRRPMSRWGAGGDVLAALTPAGIVLVVAAGSPGLRNRSCVRRPGQRGQRRRRRRLGSAANGVVEVEPGLRVGVRRRLRRGVGCLGQSRLAPGGKQDRDEDSAVAHAAKLFTADRAGTA